MKRPLAMLTARAFAPSGKGMVTMRWKRVQKGLPGGCPVSRQAAVRIYSGQSQ
jgi:hypothetical protein